MIIKYIESKATTNQAPRYAEVLSAYMGEGKRAQHQELLRLEASPAMEHGLTLAAYMMHSEGAGEAQKRRSDATKKADDATRVLERGAVTGNDLLTWEEGLADMRRRLKRKLSPGAKAVRHVVQSLQAGSARPSDAECGESLRLLLEELGCPEALGLWALHGDTDNLHLHLLIITVKPVDAKMTEFGNQAGYKDSMQRAIARIDDALGLTPEPGTRYEMRAGKLVRRDRPRKQERRGPPISAHILQWERESGIASFTRMAQERAAPVLRDAESWDEAHRALAAAGMVIRPKAGGGEIQAGDEHVKLAHVGRDLTWRKLTAEKRLGRYTPPPTNLEVGDYYPRIDDPEQFHRWRELRHRRAALAAGTERRISALRATRDRAIAQVRRESEALLSSLAPSAPSYVRRQLGERLRGARDEHIAGLHAAFDARIAAIRSLRDDAASSLDDVRFDTAAFSLADAVVTGGVIISPRTDILEGPQGYRCRQVGKTLQFWDGDLSAASRTTPAFTDHGEVFFVNALDPRHIEHVLRRASDRFDRVAVAGTPQFIAECRRVASDLGLTIDVGEHHLAPASRPSPDVGWRRLPEEVGEKQAKKTSLRRTFNPSELRGTDPGREIER